MRAYIAEIETKVAGIPCLIGVSSYLVQRPCYYADNRDDFYGYTECDYDILDRNGRRATWLERKLTSDDDCRLQTEIDTFFDKCRDSHDY